MDLRIFDTSNYIYAGDATGRKIQRGIRESDGMYEANDAPIGGIRFLIHQLGNYVCNQDTHLMPVFDATPTIKRKMYEDTFGDSHGYKGTRTRDPNINIDLEKRYAYDILKDIGFTVQRVEGYEADDVIYTLVESLKNDYEHIYIHTRDSDLAFLVSDTVSIEPVGKQGKHIDLANYPFNVIRGYDVNYNCLNYYKLAKGDKADNIPGIGSEWLEAIGDTLSDADLRNSGDLNFARKCLRETIMKHPELLNGHMVLPTFNILVPLYVNVDELDFYDADIDINKLNYYLHDWSTSEDRWDLEEMLADYIHDYYR